ncbi:CxC2 domain-containing protein [Mycena sanguinolenta]|uniref:CxC2 domain-containing protein n=1 Tax=Mycena sanguinolenta TaxID=230812 RepID=A0A8H6XRB0_9AGAR|nr:CxC2 domain-containing protein [Mycena sanguinolenta]
MSLRRMQRQQNGSRNNSGKTAKVSTTMISSNVPQFTLRHCTADGEVGSEQRQKATGTRATNIAAPATQTTDEAPPLVIADSDLPSELADSPNYGATAAYAAEAGQKPREACIAVSLEMSHTWMGSAPKKNIFWRTSWKHNTMRGFSRPAAATLANRTDYAKSAGADCLQAPVVCRKCWLETHRTMPTHWALVWNSEEKFFEKTDISRVQEGAGVFLGHDGNICRHHLSRPFTLVDSNGIHATMAEMESTPLPHFRQLLRAGIFPGSVKEPKTGYTLTLLERFRQQRNQDKGSLYDFVHVLQRLADPIFAEDVPNIQNHLGNIIRFHQLIDLKLRRGHAYAPEEALPGETDRPYPNCPPGYLGMICAACPERGVNMPVDTTTPEYIRHLISTFFTKDGNFKLNLFWKRDDGTDIPLTDAIMYFAGQEEWARVAREIRIAKEDKEPPCRAHIGAIRHQGKLKYGNTAISGVVASACEHAVVGSFVDLVLGEAFGFVTMADYHHLKQTNSPPHDTSQRAILVKERNVARGENIPEEESAMYHTVDVSHVDSYDSYCSSVVNQLKRAVQLFPSAHWFHEKLRISEGQVAAAHINDHGTRCKTMWQPVYFPARAHFHGESAERIWAFLNALGASTRQMNGGARHDTINFVMDGWNTSKVLRQAELLAAERLEALDLFLKHMAVVKYLSNEHSDEVGEWSKMSRVCRNESGALHSVYQHRSRTLPTIDDVLDTIIDAEREKGKKDEDEDDGPPMGMYLVVALLKSQKEHPLMETLAAIRRLRETMNQDLADFRERQRTFLPRVKLSALDDDEPEATKLQFPSYLVKHGRLDATAENQELRELELKLRFGQANEAVLAVQAASLALSAIRKTEALDYRGQAGKSRSSRAIQKAMMVKVLEITMYNVARDALIVLGGVVDGPDAAYPPLTMRDTSRKETHLFRANGDSRRFDGAAMYLKDGLSLPDATLASSSARQDVGGVRDESPERMVGTQTLKRAGFTKKPDRPTKRLKKSPEEEEPIPAEESDPDSDAGGKSASPAKKARERPRKQTKSDGWIWMEGMIGREGATSEKMAEYKRESDRVQWFRAEAEMYRWREQWERKHAEMMRVIARFVRDAEVWNKCADHIETSKQRMGAVTYAREQAAIYRRLAHNAQITFKDPKSAAHADWVAAETFEDLIRRIDASRELDFKWMDEMGISRAYKTKDFKQPKRRAD